MFVLFTTFNNCLFNEVSTYVSYRLFTHVAITKKPLSQSASCSPDPLLLSRMGGGAITPSFSSWNSKNGITTVSQHYENAENFKETL